MELDDVHGRDDTVAVHIVQHKAELLLLLIILEDPVLDSLYILIQVELLGEFECVQDDLSRSCCEAPAKILEQVLLRASVPV